jgi:hypothetical protein
MKSTFPIKKFKLIVRKQNEIFAIVFKNTTNDVMVTLKIILHHFSSQRTLSFSNYQ